VVELAYTQDLGSCAARHEGSTPSRVTMKINPASLLKPKLDETESAYELAILRALNKGDNDRAYGLSIGLKQYREMYKE
jgi:hypothetical protein